MSQGTSLYIFISVESEKPVRASNAFLSISFIELFNFRLKVDHTLIQDLRGFIPKISVFFRCCLSFFALVGCATLGIGFWGNQLVHQGMVGFERAMENIDTTVKSAQTFVNRYNEVMSKDIEQSMNRLFDGPFQRKVR